MTFPLLRFLVGVALLLLTRPPTVFSFLGVLAADLGFLGVVLAETAPRAGASGRSPESTSAFSVAASFLMIRKRPSMES